MDFIEEAPYLKHEQSMVNMITKIIRDVVNQPLTADWGRHNGRVYDNATFQNAINNLPAQLHGVHFITERNQITPDDIRALANLTEEEQEQVVQAQLDHVYLDRRDTDRERLLPAGIANQMIEAIEPQTVITRALRNAARHVPTIDQETVREFGRQFADYTFRTIRGDRQVHATEILIDDHIPEPVHGDLV